MARGTRDDPLTDEEFAAHWAAMVAAWRAALMDREKPPGPDHEWVDGVGWVKRATPREGKRR